MADLRRLAKSHTSKEIHFAPTQRRQHDFVASHQQKNKGGLEMNQGSRFCPHCKRPSNKSGFHGVFAMRSKSGTYWRAVLKGEYIGSFSSPEFAARAYDQVAREKGIAVALNFPVEASK
jgi:hypothetical protein